MGTYINSLNSNKQALPVPRKILHTENQPVSVFPEPHEDAAPIEKEQKKRDWKRNIVLGVLGVMGIAIVGVAVAAIANLSIGLLRKSGYIVGAKINPEDAIQEGILKPYQAENIKAIKNESARNTFERLVSGTIWKGGKDVNASVGRIDDIVQKYNMCSDEGVRKNVVELLSGKKIPDGKTIRDAEKLLDTVNEQNGLYTPLSRFCYTKEELPKIQNELEKFYDEVFLPQAKPLRKPKIKLEKIGTDNVAGYYTALDDSVSIGEEILTNPFQYKLISKKTGKVIESPDFVNQIAGISKKLALARADRMGLKDFDIVMLTKEERLKRVKLYLAHENFHSIQFNNMALHPEIGNKKVFMSLEERGKGLPIIKKICLELKMKLRNLILCIRNPKLKEGTELYTQTLDQYNTWLEYLKAARAGKACKTMLLNTATELDAYNKERLFAIKNGLLI